MPGDQAFIKSDIFAEQLIDPVLSLSDIYGFIRLKVPIFSHLFIDKQH